MMEYEFETVSVHHGFAATRISDHREIIRRRQKQGWRFAGWIPTGQRGYGYISEIDLIFERETEAQA